MSQHQQKQGGKKSPTCLGNIKFSLTGAWDEVKDVKRQVWSQTSGLGDSAWFDRNEGQAHRSEQGSGSLPGRVDAGRYGVRAGTPTRTRTRGHVLGSPVSLGRGRRRTRSLKCLWRPGRGGESPEPLVTRDSEHHGPQSALAVALPPFRVPRGAARG